MLRNLQIKPNKPVETDYKASVLLHTGMGVTKDYANKTVGLPSAEVGVGIFVVDKERIATGYKAALTDLSDYDTDFNTIQAGEFCKLHEFETGERRAVDQFVKTGLTIGCRVAVNNAGKWIKATSTVESSYIFTGYHTSDGHELATIECVANIGKNA